MSYKIEKNIPIPMSNKKGDGATPTYPFLQMEVGDSFFVKCDKIKRSSICSSILGSTRRVPNMKFTTRRYVDGVRVWRIV